MSEPAHRGTLSDLVFTPDPEDPGGHVYVIGDPVPEPIRRRIKHFEGVFRKHRNPPGWWMRTVMARALWAELQAEGHALDWTEQAAPPPRRRLMECPNCCAARWTDEPGCCPHCGSAAPMVTPPGTHRADSPPPDPVPCPACRASAPPGPRHCPREPAHRVDRNGNYCPQPGCGAQLCTGLARWDRHGPPEVT